MVLQQNKMVVATRPELIILIEDYLKKQRKKMTNLKTAKKDVLLEICMKYGLDTEKKEAPIPKKDEKKEAPIPKKAEKKEAPIPKNTDVPIGKERAIGENIRRKGVSDTMDMLKDAILKEFDLPDKKKNMKLCILFNQFAAEFERSNRGRDESVTYLWRHPDVYDPDFNDPIYES